MPNIFFFKYRSSPMKEGNLFNKGSGVTGQP